MNDNEKLDELASELLETSEHLRDEEFDDERLATMVRATMRVLAYLLVGYSQGNKEMTTLFAHLMMDFFDELKEEEEKLKKFDLLVEGIDLD